MNLYKIRENTKYTNEHTLQLYFEIKKNPDSLIFPMMFPITNSKTISPVLLKLRCFANCIAKIGLGDSELK